MKIGENDFKEILKNQCIAFGPTESFVTGKNSRSYYSFVFLGCEDEENGILCIYEYNLI
jgi:hypothetical protein